MNKQEGIETCGRNYILDYWIAFGFLALLLMSFIVWNINSGSIEISVREIMEILFLGKGEDTAL